MSSSPTNSQFSPSKYPAVSRPLFALKNGRRSVYAVDIFMRGFTSSVPSLGRAVLMPSQPCHILNMVHAPSPS